MSVHAGLRYQTIESQVAIPASDYTISAETSSGTAYLIGAAYEKPEIALHFALIFSSAIEHSQSVTEPGLGTSTVDLNRQRALTWNFNLA